MTDSSFAPTVYQTFDIRTDRKTVAPRLKALRAAMREAGVDAFLVPRTDAHRGEMVPASEARLAYVTSFTGSAGLAIIGSRKAALFVDGRYTLQAPAETDTKAITVLEAAQGGYSARIGEFVTKGGKVGFDPWLHTPSEIADLEKKLAGRAVLVPIKNLIDQVWDERPAPPNAPIEFLGHNRAGKAAPDKLAEIRAAMGEDNADAVVLTVPESINWLFNMRGRDVPHVPVVLCYALVPKSGMPTLFFNGEKITPELRKGLEGLAKVADVKT
ncbi:MAG: aminopeptidase P family N-terminal domain-containing protein, partial [Acidobacteria bacterium]|nr:aminopeptidase P family N-terminal domain-containing protein [Acidobacteriota bacterium]